MDDRPDHKRPTVYHSASISTGHLAQSRRKMPLDDDVHWELVSPEFQVPLDSKDSSFQSTLIEREDFEHDQVVHHSSVRSGATHIRASAKPEPIENIEDVSELGRRSSEVHVRQRQRGIPYLALKNPAPQELGTQSMKASKNPRSGSNATKQYGRDVVEVRTVLSSVSTSKFTRKR